MSATPDPALFDKVVNLCKRRGFVFPSAEIYGGFRSTYDYGPLGVLMLRNVKDAWWRSMVQLRDDVVGLDAAILSPPAVWEASGHLANFTDPLVDCRDCKERFRLDKLDDPNTCPSCGKHGTFTEARQFNLMFKTHAGPVEGAGHEVYLRPETAQGMFLNFKNVLETSRKKPPFGIAQVGKSFRNEITPGNFVFRTREFEQMEMEYFVPPDEGQQWYEYWCQQRHAWYIDLGIPLRPAAAAAPRRRRAVPLLLGHVRRGVPLPVGLGRARGHRQPGRLRPHPARQALGREARVLRPGHQRALRAPRHRAGRRRHPHDDGVPHGRLRRGGGERRAAHACCASTTGSRPYKVAVLPALQEGHAHARRPRGVRAPAPRTSCATTTRPRPSAAATAARTRSARPVCVTVDFESLGRPRRHRPRPRLDGPGAGPDRRSARQPPGRLD